MTWIRTLSFEEADERLRKIYGQVQMPDGHIDNILKVHSLRPQTLTGHLALYKSAMHSKPNALTPRERELVGVCVSLSNECDYCVEHHRAGLARHVGDEGLAGRLTEASQLQGDISVLTPREQELCRYALKLTRSPAAMRESDLAPLRSAGLDHAGILDLNQIVSYFAYANRTVLGLGITTDGEPLGLHPDEDREGYEHA